MKPIPEDRTDDERKVLDLIAQDRGEEFVKENWQLILRQAAELGEIDSPRFQPQEVLC